MRMRQIQSFYHERILKSQLVPAEMVSNLYASPAEGQ